MVHLCDCKPSLANLSSLVPLFKAFQPQFDSRTLLLRLHLRHLANRTCTFLSSLIQTSFISPGWMNIPGSIQIISYFFFCLFAIFFFLLHSLLFYFLFFFFFSFYDALETVKLSAVWPLISHSFQTDRWSRHSSLRCCFQTAFPPVILFVSEPKQLSTESQHQQPQPQVVRGQKSRLLLLPCPSIICKLAWGAISQTNAP